MNGLIILGAFVLIFGSFMMLKPSARDARLAKLRFQAGQQGLQVRQVIWESNPKKTGIYDAVRATGYTLMRPNADKPGELKFAIVAQKGWNTEHLPAGFAWHEEGSKEQAEQFQQALSHLPDEILMLEVWENKVLLVPKEGIDSSALAYKHFMEGFFA